MKTRGWLVGVGLAVLLAGCAAAGNPAVTAPGTPGFWMGLWHGIIFPVTFFVSLFNHDVGVYAAANDGNWYNFGFFLGIAMSMGGGAKAGTRCPKRRPRSDL